MQTATNKDPNVDAAYGDPMRLERIYTEAAAEHLDIVGLSIATRPDCLGRNALAMLERLAAKKPLWVELGLQTSNEETAKRINRGYALSAYEKAMADLAALPDRAKMERRQETCPGGHESGAPCKRNSTGEGMM